MSTPHNELAYYSLAFIIGCCVGSFLNVIALRSLKEQSFVWPASYCPHCHKSLWAIDNIPIISYLFLQGKCRFCKNPISWQYPAVELVTGIIFVLITMRFLFGFIPYRTSGSENLWANIAAGIHSLAMGQIAIDMPWELKIPLTIGMLVFASTLIATCITDIREKLIPHEITYPSMLIGICFSAYVRHDVLGALAGIGISYILFDFLAYYGLKVYMHFHRHDIEEDSDNQQQVDEEIDQSIAVKDDQAEEPIEVMGGGDAVLSAVIASYVGWQILVFALVIGFVVGTVMGLMLLVNEIKKAELFKPLINKSRSHVAIGLLAFGLFGFAFDRLLEAGGQGAINSHLALPFAVLGALAGLLMSIVSVGSQVSKPFPFGPALAIGGFIAMFIIPTWMAFY